MATKTGPAPDVAPNRAIDDYMCRLGASAAIEVADLAGTVRWLSKDEDLSDDLGEAGRNG